MIDNVFEIILQKPCVVCGEIVKHVDTAHLYAYYHLHVCLYCSEWLGSLSRWWDNHSIDSEKGHAQCENQ